MSSAGGAARPARLVLVVGTGTEVGKTWVSARLLEAWRAAGHRVAARKLAQSYAPGAGPTDAEVLGAASGEAPERVCLPERWYPVPMAPPMAAAALGRPGPRLGELLDGLAWPLPAPTVGLVEMAGGVRSPQADDADAVDVLTAVGPDRVVLVAHAGLGTVNAVRCAVDALAGAAPAAGAPVTVVLNRFDADEDVHRRNRDWLVHRVGLTVVAVVPGALERLAASLVS